MTKQLYPAPGRVIVTVLLTDKKSVFQYTGQSSTVDAASASMNVFKDFNKLVENAKLDAVYQHMYKRNLSFTYDHPFNIQVIDFDIVYFDQIADRKRVKRFDKRTGKEENWNEVRHPDTGKLISRIKSRKAELDESVL